MKYFLYILFGYILICCNHRNTQTETTLNLDSLKREELKITIIEDTTKIKWFTNGSKNLWTPTENKLNLVDSILVRAIKDEIEKVGIDYYNLLKPDTYNKYYRKYICYINSYGDSIVYINAMCEVHSLPLIDKNGGFLRDKNGKVLRHNWQYEIFNVEDGGDCFWHIWINISKKTYKDLMINGR